MKPHIALYAVLLLLLSIMTGPTLAAPPDIPSPDFPVNNEVVHTNAPSFNWGITSTEATQYRLIVRNAALAVVYKRTFESAEICNTTSCTAFPGTEDVTFRNGAHTWRVIALNTEGRARTPWQTFRVDFPGAPVLLQPLPDAEVSLPFEIAWEEVAQADQYRVTLRRLVTGERYRSAWLNAADICGATCSVSMDTPMRRGQYRWFVHARQVTFPTDRSKSEVRNLRIVRPPSS